MDAMVERAIMLATEKHSGQTDKLGEPYILHPLRVMLAVPADPELRAIAVMHDLMEDTDVTSITLFLDGWDQRLIDALIALTAVTTSRMRTSSNAARRIAGLGS